MNRKDKNLKAANNANWMLNFLLSHRCENHIIWLFRVPLAMLGQEHGQDSKFC